MALSAARDRLRAELSGWRVRRGWLGRPTPTADVYFLNAMGDLVAAEGPIVPLGPNLFATESAYVILRYISESELARLEAASRQRVYYVIDDDLAGIAGSADFPHDYRRRIGDFVRRMLPRILRLEPTIVAPSQLILDAFPAHPTQLVSPSYTAVRQQFGHFAAMERASVVFTGTRSHLADLQAVMPAITRFCAGFPNASFTTFLGRHAPPPLQALANVTNHAAMSWPDYRLFLARSSYHIALAPFRPTPLNQCRSHNKIHDHAALGAVGVYGDIGPYREAITHGTDGLLLPSDERLWFEALAGLMADPPRARRLAERGAILSRQLGDPGAQRAFWLNLLGLADRHAAFKADPRG